MVEFSYQGKLERDLWCRKQQGYTLSPLQLCLIPVEQAVTNESFFEHPVVKMC